MKRLLLLLAVLACVGSSATAATCSTAVCTTMHDVIPNFAGSPTIRAVRSGAWADASTWDRGRTPTASDVVLVPSAVTVTVADQAAVAMTVGVAGVLRLQPDVPTRLAVATLQILPLGTLEVGTRAAPVTARAELLVTDTALDLLDDSVGVFDPRQFGTGLLSVDGTLTVAGQPKTTWVRVAAVPTRGDTRLQLAAPVSGWHPGDRLVLPDSRHIPSSQPASTYVDQGEEATVQAVSADGLSVTLAAPLAFTHPGARDGDDVLEFLPHVGNLTRSIIIRSQNPAGTRGHIFVTERTTLDARYAEVRNMGRTTLDPVDATTFDPTGKVLRLGTNHIGRYPVHVHHTPGPVVAPTNGYQFTLEGLAVTDDATTVNRHKNAVTVHGSHYGLITQNVVYNAGGWGIGTEDGSESFNEFSSNFVVKVRGEGTREFAEGGNGLWFRGPNNYVRDNVIANVRGTMIEGSHGIQYYQVYLGTICIPTKKGADMSQCTTRNGNALPLLEFARNEVYGAMEIGLGIWWLGALNSTPLATAPSTVRDFRVWHFSLYGYYGYQASQLTFDGVVARGAKAVLGNANEFLRGLWFSDYMNHNLTIRRADIQNLRTGILAPYYSSGLTVIEDSYLRNSTNIQISTMGAPGSWASGASQLPAKSTLIRRVRFGRVNTSVGPSVAQYDIHMNYWTQFGAANLVKSDVTTVEAFNGVTGDDFQVFYHEQRPDFVVPQSSGNLVGAPVAGLTNAQTWATYGIAIAGEVATNAGPRPGIYGLVRPSGGQVSTPTPAVLTLTGLTRTYDGRAQAVTVGTVPPGLSGVTVTYDGLATPPVHAGRYAVVASLSAPGYSAVPATGTLVIQPAPAKVSTASATVVQGAPVPTFQAQVSGLLAGDVLTGAPTCSSAAGSTATAGTFAVTCAPGTLAMPDYAFTFGSATLTVTAAAPPRIDTLAVHTSAPNTLTRSRSTSTLQVAALPGTLTLTVGVTSASPVRYQWQRDLKDIPGATSPSYSGPVAAGRYRCVVVNGGGRVTSTLVSVSVQ